MLIGNDIYKFKTGIKIMILLKEYGIVTNKYSAEREW